MFKKSLLALSVASLAASANAGSIFSDITNAVTASASDFTVSSPALATEALGANGAIGGADDNCDAAAADLGVSLTGSDTNIASAGGNNDTITATAANDNVFVAQNQVAMTGLGTCTVLLADKGVTTAAKSPLEAPAGTVDLTVEIVPGIGGYDQEDTITLTFAGAKIDTALSTNPTLTLATGTPGDGDIEILDITETAVRFTVKDAGGVDNDDILTLAGIVLDSTGLSASTDVKLDAFATNTSGTQFDVIPAVSVHQLVPQYSAKVTTKFDGIIDVSEDRQSLALNDADLLNPVAGVADEADDQDTLLIDVDLDATVNEVAAQDITFVVKGDFAWLAEAADTTANDNAPATAAQITTYLNAADVYSTDGGANFGDASSYALNDELTELTIKDTTISSASAVEAVYGLRLEVPGQGANNPVLNTQNFTVTAFATDGVASPNTNTLTAASNADAGSWTLNGSVVTVPYMPFGPNTKVIMRHTNTGVQSGDVSVRYMLEGVSTNWETVGVVTTTTRGVQNIRDLVIDAVMADAGVESGKVAIEITSNVPAADVTVYAAFNVKNSADDRGFVGTFGAHGSADTPQ